jgi:hypothetical protein
MRKKVDWSSIAQTVAQTSAASLSQQIAHAIQSAMPDDGGGYDAAELLSSDEFKKAVRDLTGPQQKVVTVKVKTDAGTKTVDGVTHKNFEHLVRMLSARLNVALVGEAGSGKSVAAEQVADALSLAFYPMSFNAKMTTTDLRGYMDATGNYNPSPIYNAFKHGGVLCLDEFDRANTEVCISLNNLLANKKYMFPNGEIVHKHDDFRVVACQNTTGNGGSKTYAAASRQDASTLNRFVILHWNIDEGMERQIAGDTVATSVCQQLRRKARELGMDIVISPRQSIHANTLMECGYSIKSAIMYSCLGTFIDAQSNKLNDSGKRLIEGIDELNS